MEERERAKQGRTQKTPVSGCVLLHGGWSMLMGKRRTHGDAGEHLGPQMQEGKDPERQRREKKERFGAPRP